MSKEYRNLDAPRLPQEVSIEFERITTDDDTSSWSDYDMDHDRVNAFRNGEWRFIGIQALAAITVPIGQGSFAVYELTSPGLWGTESDSTPEYLNDIYEEEKAALVAALKAIGHAITKQFPEE